MKLIVWVLASLEAICEGLNNVYVEPRPRQICLSMRLLCVYRYDLAFSIFNHGSRFSSKLYTKRKYPSEMAHIRFALLRYTILYAHTIRSNLMRKWRCFSDGSKEIARNKSRRNCFDGNVCDWLDEEHLFWSYVYLIGFAFYCFYLK